jgi:hypothetical protein
MNQWINLLRNIPVSINNFYGDPMVQWPDTCKKLADLAEIGHTGPIGIITKGVIQPKHAQHLADLCNFGMNIIVLVSISELHGYEKVGHAHRYTNIRHLADAGVPNIAYIRPFIPPYNTSQEIVAHIMRNVADNGGKIAVASGFRGDEAMVGNMAADKAAEWVMRVKQMPPATFAYLKQTADMHGIQLFTRTACAVSYISGHDRPYNPYFNSRRLVKCADLRCPLLNTCGAANAPHNGSSELLAHLGYDLEFVLAREGAACCNISGENRLSCPSCCTTCYIATAPITHLRVKSECSLGDLAFIRFVSGLMAMKSGVADDGSKEIGNVHLPNYPHIKFQCLNTWFPIARTIAKCYGCAYCVVAEYYNTSTPNTETGFSPARLLEMI